MEAQHDKLLLHLTVIEFDEANQLYGELLSRGVDIARAIGCVYRMGRLDQRRLEKDRRREYYERRQASLDVEKDAKVLEELLNDGGATDE